MDDNRFPIDANATVRITVARSNRSGFPRSREPVRLGVPLSCGVVIDADHLALFASSGQPQPLQTRVLDRWHDGSIRWLLLDFLADHDGVSPAEYELRFAAAGGVRPPVVGQLRIDEQGSGFVVDTGAARFGLLPGNRFPFDNVLTGGVSVLDASRVAAPHMAGRARGRWMVRASVPGPAPSMRATSSNSVAMRAKPACAKPIAMARKRMT